MAFSGPGAPANYPAGIPAVPQNSNVSGRKNQLEVLNAVVVPSVPTTHPPAHTP